MPFRCDEKTEGGRGRGREREREREREEKGKMDREWERIMYEKGRGSERGWCMCDSNYSIRCTYLSGLRSLWMTPQLWMYSSASTVSEK